MPHRRDVEQEEVGSRSFTVQRNRAVEEAVAHIRHGLGANWDLLTPDEVTALEWMLGEAWTVVGTRRWGGIGFNQVTLERAEEMVDLGERAQSGRIVKLQAVRQVEEWLAALPSPGEPPAGPGSDEDPQP